MNRLEESAFFHLSSSSSSSSMATAASNTNSSKRRQTFFSQFLSPKNLSIFRNKTSTGTNTLNTCKQSPQYKSQANLPTVGQQQPTPIPMCISRGWLKKRSKRPISLDLDLVKTFAQQSAANHHGQLPADEHQQSLNDMGTIMDRLSLLYIYFLRGDSEGKNNR